MPIVNRRKNTEDGGSSRLMRIGELSRRAGTTMRTIRYYEEIGLLSPVGRTKGGFRLYEEVELKKLHLIRNLQRLSIPLAAVKALFDQRVRGLSAAEIVPGLQRLLRTQLEGLEQEMLRHRRMQESVRQTIDLLQSCAECGRIPGPTTCGSCPTVASLDHVPLHMQAIVETA